MTATLSAQRSRTSLSAAWSFGRRYLVCGIALFAYAVLASRLMAEVAAGANDSKLNGFVLVAAMASLFLLAKAASERSRGVFDGLAAVLVAICIAANLADVATFCFGLFLLSTGTRGSYRSAGGIVMLAVCLRVVWAPLILHMVAPVILPVDAALTYHVLSLYNPGVELDGNVVMSSPDFGIDIQEPCSSFHNVSLASLAVVTIAMLARRRFVAHDLTVLAVIAATQIALNITRLSLMAPDESAFAFWHDGLGKQGLAALGTLLAIVIAITGVRWATGTASTRAVRRPA